MSLIINMVGLIMEGTISDILTTDVPYKVEGGYKGAYVHLLILKKFL